MFFASLLSASSRTSSRASENARKRGCVNAHSPKIAKARKPKPYDVKLVDEAERLGLLDGSNGELTFWPRSLLQVTLPHSDPGNVPVWGRRSGNFYLTVEPGHALDRAGQAQSFGYPYGSIPRLVCAYFNSQVKRQKSKRIDLGPSLADFMEQLGLGPFMTGGANGSITRLKRQVLALANARIAFGCETPAGVEMRENASPVARRYQLWWSPKSGAGQHALFPSFIDLSDEFFDEMMRHGVPVNLAALKALKRSPLALDLYAWATYRNHNRKGRLAVPWALLAAQFGAEYSSSEDFAKAAKEAFRHVQVVYPDLALTFERGRVILGEASTHVGGLVGIRKPVDKPEDK